MSAAEEGRRAWARIAGSDASLDSIQLLDADNSKSRVIRITSSKSAGHSVIGKWAPTEVVRLEAHLYRGVLPSLGQVHPRVLGQEQSEETGWSWLFMEEVFGRRFDQSDLAHRDILSRTIARLHENALSGLDLDCVPSRGPDDLFEAIAGRRQRMRTRWETCRDRRERAVVASVLESYDRVLTGWPRIALVLDEWPPVLVHGDLSAENLLVLGEDPDLEVVVLDWEKAAVGPCSIDLVHMALDMYATHRPTFKRSLQRLEHHQQVGTLLRVLQRRLYRKSRSKLEDYEERIAHLLGTLRIPATNPHFGVVREGHWAALARRAWASAGRDEVPVGVEELKARPPTSVVVKMRFTSRPPVVGKRSSTPELKVEEDVLRQILPLTPVEGPRWIVSTPADAVGARWLFCEHLASERPSAEDARRALGWAVGVLHASTADQQGPPSVHLPSLATDAYRTATSRTRRALELVHATRTFQPSGETTLRILLDYCRQVEDTFDEIATRLADLPMSLVHGDVVPKNARFRKAARGRFDCALIDWGQAGWGHGVLDLAFVDLGTYRAARRTLESREPDLNFADLQALGYMFWLLRAVGWELQGIGRMPPPRRLRRMQYYAEELVRWWPCAARRGDA